MTDNEAFMPNSRSENEFIYFFAFAEPPENMTAINTPNINFKWDPKSLEIRTLAVERLLEPLVTQVEISLR